MRLTTSIKKVKVEGGGSYSITGLFIIINSGS